MKTTIRLRAHLFQKRLPGCRFPRVAGLLGLWLLCACSSAPKSAGDVYDLRGQAESQLDLGNKQADRGNYETALTLLNEARRIAVSADDPRLRVRTSLSLGNVLFALGRGEDAGANWQNALTEAEREGNQELAAVSRIHQARGRLLSAVVSFSHGDNGSVGDDGSTGANSTGGGSPAAIAQAVRDEIGREMAAVKDRSYIAFAWLVIGLAEKELGRYAEAESAVKKGLDIHEKDLYLEQAAYDWYLIASFRSLSGNYNGARQALESAMVFDRRVENSYGLATDWRALGDVFKKAGSPAESRQAYLRSAEIFRSLGNDKEAAGVEKQIEPASSS